MNSRFSERVRENPSSKSAVISRTPCEPTQCEGIIKQDADAAPTTIDHCTTFRVGLREPTSTGKYHEKSQRFEFAEIPRMSEALVIGCPD